MKKFMATIASITAVIALSLQPGNAQTSRTSGMDSLATRTCRTIEGNGGLGAINEVVAVGRNMLTAVSILGIYSGYNPEGSFDVMEQRIMVGRPLEVVCGLADPGESPSYRTLILAFGHRSDGRAMNNGTRVRLSIFLDGNLANSQTIRADDVYVLPLDITNKRSVSLRADCHGAETGTSCPNIYFMQDTLVR